MQNYIVSASGAAKRYAETLISVPAQERHGEKNKINAHLSQPNSPPHALISPFQTAKLARAKFSEIGESNAFLLDAVMWYSFRKVLEKVTLGPFPLPLQPSETLKGEKREKLFICRP